LAQSYSEALLSWKAEQPQGLCKSCQDGPVLQAWKRGTDVCSWFARVEVAQSEKGRGVSRCNSTTQLFDKLDLSGLGIRGTLPFIFSQLQDLTDLYLEENHLTGTIPKEWSSFGMSKSEMDINLKLGRNKLHGSLPVEWSRGTRSLQFEAQYNSITGQLPRSWSSLKLMKLQLEGNLISGTLPSSWTTPQLSSTLNRLDLGMNHLTGTVPHTYAGLTALEDLRLSGNFLNGSVPSEWSQMSSIRELDLQDNELTGIVAPALREGLETVEIDLRFNRLDLGRPPRRFPSKWEVEPQGALSPRAVLLEWKRRLPRGACAGCSGGPVFRTWQQGTDICDWHERVRLGDGAAADRGVDRCSRSSQAFRLLNLNGLGVGGPLPPELGDLWELGDLLMADNAFTGTLPAQWSSLGQAASDTEITLSRNRLTGTLPMEWSHHAREISLLADSNSLNGTLPSAWSDIRLVKLDLRWNGLTGTLPRSWLHFTEVRLGNNQLEGKLPDSWGNVSSAEVLDLSWNGLTGGIPEAWTSFHRLQEMNLQGNVLEGSIPSGLADGANSTRGSFVLDVSRNNMTIPDSATFPDTWIVKPQKQTLDVQDRSQSLPPPASLTAATAPNNEMDRLVIAGASAAGGFVFIIAVAVLIFLKIRNCPFRYKNGILPDDYAVGIPISSTSIQQDISSPEPTPELRRLTSIEQQRNVKFKDLSQRILDLHEGMPDAYKQLPIRLLDASFVRCASYLPCFEELEADFPGSFLDIPYINAAEKLWGRTFVVSWRWTLQKPSSQMHGFCPMSPHQLSALRSSLELAQSHRQATVRHVWVDWSCVPQYSASPMSEISRSKLYYARAQTMCVIPQAISLPEGSFRVVLSNICRTLEDEDAFPNAPPMHVKMAQSALSALRNDAVHFKRGYFGRVWTLSERMARHGREESLKNWMPLAVWESIVLDIMWDASDPGGAPPGMGHDFRWEGLLDPVVLQDGVDALEVVRRTGSHLVPSSINHRVASVFVHGVGCWQSRKVTEEVDPVWLRKYLQHEAGTVYQSGNLHDAVWAIYSFFCWHQRQQDEFAEALSDLCTVAGIAPEQSVLSDLS